jgi:hypothetical protein
MIAGVTGSHEHWSQRTRERDSSNLQPTDFQTLQLLTSQRQHDAQARFRATPMDTLRIRNRMDRGCSARVQRGGCLSSGSSVRRLLDLEHPPAAATITTTAATTATATAANVSTPSLRASQLSGAAAADELSDRRQLLSAI